MGAVFPPRTATRPLAIQKNGTWYTYGWDLTKNICETYRTDGRIDLAYTPYGLEAEIPHGHYWGNREQVDGRDERVFM